MFFCPWDNYRGWQLINTYNNSLQKQNVVYAMYVLCVIYIVFSYCCLGMGAGALSGQWRFPRMVVMGNLLAY